MKASSVLTAALALCLSSIGAAGGGSTASVTFEVRGMQKTASGAT